MAHQVSITNKELFTINCKTVYKKNKSWYANPFLNSEESKQANEIIKKLNDPSLAIKDISQQLNTNP